MAERRSLVEGVKPAVAVIDPIRDKAERNFVFAEKTREGGEAHLPSPTTQAVARSPFSTRIRTDLTVALKRASLERQLKGVEPNSLVEILEQAIEPWLKSNGYLS